MKVSKAAKIWLDYHQTHSKKILDQIILSQRTNTHKLHKVSHFRFRKNLYQKTELYEI